MGARKGPQERQANECLALKNQVGGRVREQGRGWKELGEQADSPDLAAVSLIFVTPSSGDLGPAVTSESLSGQRGAQCKKLHHQYIQGR